MRALDALQMAEVETRVFRLAEEVFQLRRQSVLRRHMLSVARGWVAARRGAAVA